MEDDELVAILYNYSDDGDIIESRIKDEYFPKSTMEDPLSYETKRNNPPYYIQVSRAVEHINPKEMLDYFESRLIGQDEEIKKIVYLFYKYLKEAGKKNPPVAQNWILTAPSGCGKTEIYRILRSYCREKNIPLPVLQIDVSNFTEAGYKGKDIGEIIEDIRKEKSKTGGRAICFLDEMDKKCVPSMNSAGVDFNAAFQSNMLTLVEGCVKIFKGRVREPDEVFDSGLTMFVLIGAFQDIRDEKQEKIKAQKNKKAPIGFYSDNDKNENTEIGNEVEAMYEDLDLEDIIEFGMREELAGRMSQVINLHKLSRENMTKLIMEKIRLISEDMKVDITISPEGVESFLEKAYTNLGVRPISNGIQTLVNNAISDVIFDLEELPESFHVEITSINEARLILEKEV